MKHLIVQKQKIASDNANLRSLVENYKKVKHEHSHLVLGFIKSHLDMFHALALRIASRSVKEIGRPEVDFDELLAKVMDRVKIHRTTSSKVLQHMFKHEVLRFFMHVPGHSCKFDSVRNVICFMRK